MGIRTFVLYRAKTFQTDQTNLQAPIYQLSLPSFGSIQNPEKGFERVRVTKFSFLTALARAAQQKDAGEQRVAEWRKQLPVI